MPGGYDRLYETSPRGLLWGSTAGRLIERVHEFCVPSRVLDLGCGDGKNALFLERTGSLVTGIDISRIAIRGLRTRFSMAGVQVRGRYSIGDVSRMAIREEFDCVVSYGLFHCLPERDRVGIHRHALQSTARNGVVLFSCLTNDIPIPKWHATEGLVAASQEEIGELFDGWQIEYREAGLIREEHPPLVPIHEHSAIWCVARKE